MADKSIGPGTVLAGRFRLEDLLSETEGAKFWRATDLTLARNVAVNVVDAHDPRAGALLVAARTSATVTDGHFLRVLDAAEEDGFVYAVNEWGSGVSLDRMLAEGPLPPRRAAWLVKEVAEAITKAHSYGVAHGRLVPENVMVTEAGSVKLIGFVVDAVLSGRPTSAEGSEPVGEHESDVENLASLLYATLVGRWPGSTQTRLPDAPREHGHPLRPRQVRAGIPRPLDAICDRVLNPGSHAGVHIETAHEICAALSDFVGDPAGAAQVGYEATSVLRADDLATQAVQWGAQGTASATPDNPAESLGTSGAAPNVQASPTGEQASTFGGATAEPAEAARTTDGSADADSVQPEATATEQPADPEATQAGAPVFHDDEGGVGWRSPGSGEGTSHGEGRAHRAAPPPPPPLPEPAPKPLFADGPPRSATRRDPDTGSGAQHQWTGQDWTGQRSGHGTGSLPPVWGPDMDDARGGPRRDAGKSWLRLAVIVATCLLLVFAVIVAFNLGRSSTDDAGSSGQDAAAQQPDDQPAQPHSIASVDDFDPQGDPPYDENPESAALAIDGKPGTAWQTMSYYGNPQLGLLKDGVGLLVDLGEPVDVSQVRLTMIGQPNSVELLAAPEGAGTPTSTDGLRQVASADNAGTQIDLDLDKPVTTQYLVVWLTSLPPGGGGYQGQIAEIVVRP